MHCVLFAYLIQRLIDVLSYILIDSSRPTNILKEIYCVAYIKVIYVWLSCKCFVWFLFQ